MAKPSSSTASGSASSKDPKKKFLDVVAKATVKTLSDLSGVKLTPGAAFVKGKRDQMPFAVGGLIGVTSSSISGSIGLCFPRIAFLNIVTKMLGEEHTEVGPGNEDAAAELLNIIFGLAKTNLNKEGFEVKMAIPSILRGGSVQSSYAKVHEVAVLPFRLEDDSEIYLEFVIKKLDKGEKAAAAADAKEGAKVGAASKQSELFRPFITAVSQTMAIQAGVKAKPEKPFMRKLSTDYSVDIAGIIGITGNFVNGSFTMGFEKDVYLKILGKMLNENYTDFEPGLEDAVSEIVNIVFGGAKVSLNAEGHNLRMAIPSVVFGRQIYSSIRNPQKPGIVVPFSTEFGRFFIEIILE